MSGMIIEEKEIARKGKKSVLIVKLVLSALLVAAAVIFVVNGKSSDAGTSGEELLMTLFPAVVCVILMFLPLQYDEMISKVAGIAGLFLYPLLSFYLVEGMFQDVSGIAGRVVVFNYLVYLAVYLLFYLFLGRCRRAIVAGNVVTMVMGLVNWFVLEFRGTPLCPWDLLSVQTAAAVASDYKFEVDATVLRNVLWMLSASAFLFHIKPQKESGVARIASGICIGVYAIVVYMMAGSSFLVEQGIQVDLWRQRAGYVRNGFWLSFVMNTRYLDVEAPEGYSVEAAEEILEKYQETDVKERNLTSIEEKPNIIMIMNEAYADLSVINEFETTVDYNLFYDSLTENTVKGNLYMSIFGGGTCNSEYEVLTGNSMSNLAPGAIAYQQYISSAYETGSLTSALKSQGYDCYAIHPMDAMNWNRETVYASMGFEDFLDITDFEDKALVRKRYTSDEATYDKLITLFEEKGENPLFLFGVTVQNHGGYDSGWEFEEPVQIQGMSQQYKRAEEYLSLHKLSDAAFEKLIHYFENVDEPTMIVMFGDHQPAVEDEFFEELYGKSLEELELEELQRRFEVPFIIWTNYDIEEKEVPAMSANYLSVEVLKYANLQLPEYFAFLDEMKEKLPVLNSNGIMDADGNVYQHWESHPYTDLVSRYKILQYNNAIDRKHALRSMYQCR